MEKSLSETGQKEEEQGNKLLLLFRNINNNMILYNVYISDEINDQETISESSKALAEETKLDNNKEFEIIDDYCALPNKENEEELVMVNSETKSANDSNIHESMELEDSTEENNTVNSNNEKYKTQEEDSTEEDTTQEDKTHEDNTDLDKTNHGHKTDDTMKNKSIAIETSKPVEDTKKDEMDKTQDTLAAENAENEGLPDANKTTTESNGIRFEIANLFASVMKAPTKYEPAIAEPGTVRNKVSV